MPVQQRRAFVLGLAGLLVWGVDATGRQQSPRLDAWPYLLRYPEVRQELKLNAAQTDRIDRAFEAAESAKFPIAELGRRVVEALDPPQDRRLSEVRYQVLLTRGAVPDELIAKLELPADRKAALAEILARNRKSNAELLRRLETENLRVPGAREKLKKQYYDAARQRLLAALTPEQRAALTRLVGKEFPAAFELAESF